MKKSILLFWILFTTMICNNELFGQYNEGVLIGKYLGQERPKLLPKIFAPNNVSKLNEYEFGSVFSNDGNEFYYGVDINGRTEIRFMTCSDNIWSKTKRVDFGKGFSCNDPFLSPDDDRLYFISDMPLSDSIYKKDIDIWYVKREGKSWSEPINVGSTINSDKNEYYISFTKNGTMYFASNTGTTDSTKWNYDIYYSEFKAGAFQKPVKLSGSINTEGYEADVFIAPDESYIIFCSYKEDGLGQGDLYISFKENGDWTKARNMGRRINTKDHELCPFVSNDGKYFFYSSKKNIYWISADIIEEIKNDNQ